MTLPLSKLGRYELLSALGSGGFGTVYRARDTVLGVVRALKVLHPALLADQVFIERFRREARFAAQLEHPHIVPVYDFGEEDGRWYLAMKFMADGSLKDRLNRDGPLPFDRALAVLRQTASALNFAHRRPERLIHRDVKPHNILFDEAGNAHLSDFGFAKALSATSNASLTRSGGMGGTPHYMPPEIWYGKEVSPATDNYSLACVFCEMLTGQLLFPGDSSPEVMTRHISGEAQFPAQWPADVPDDLTELIKRALVKDPAKRFAHASDFVEALELLYHRSSDKYCRVCLAQLFDHLYCPNCGHPARKHKLSAEIIPGYPHRTEGPSATLFPPVPLTRWPGTDLVQRRPFSQRTTPVSGEWWTLTLTLDAGEYDVAVWSDRRDASGELTVLACADSFRTLGTVQLLLPDEQISPAHVARLSLREHAEGLWLGVAASQSPPGSAPGLMLIPRLGKLWRAESLRHAIRQGSESPYGSRAGDGAWSVQASEWQNDYLVYGPYIRLDAGDYVAIFRLTYSNWSSDGTLLHFDVNAFFHDPESDDKAKDTQVAQLSIEAAGISAKSRFQEIILPFRLDARSDRTEFRVRTLAPVDVTLDCVRLATPEQLILERYFELGGTGSKLGRPLGPAFCAAPSPYKKTQGYVQRFEAGAVYWSPESGAVEVYGAIGYHFEKLEGTHGFLGYPRTSPKKVASSFGTVGTLQYFEEYNGQAAMYLCQWPWGEMAHEVHGGIADSTYNELGGHEGRLGFPMTDELIVEKDEQHDLRRSKFEGGFVEWIWEKDKWWRHLRTVLYARPEIQRMVWQPADVHVGEPVTVRLVAKNIGEEVEQGYLTLSFPDLTDEEVIARADVSNPEHHLRLNRAGTEAYGRYGHKGYKLEYPRVEAMYLPWKAGAEHWLEVTLHPMKAGPLKVFARTTVIGSLKYEEHDLRGDGDPSPFSEGPTDHQAERVYEYLIDVQATKQ